MQADERAGGEQAGHPLASVLARSCILCCACRNVCPSKALHIHSGRMLVDANLCDGCGACVLSCLPDAIALVPRQ